MIKKLKTKEAYLFMYEKETKNMSTDMKRLLKESIIATYGRCEEVKEKNKTYFIFDYDETKDKVLVDNRKGRVVKDSLRFKMAQQLINANGGEKSRSGFLKLLGFNNEVMNSIDDLIYKEKEKGFTSVAELFVKQQISSDLTSLNDYIKGALKLIDEGKFEGATLEKNTYISFCVGVDAFGNSKYEHFNVNEDIELYNLYLEVKELADTKFSNEYPLKSVHPKFKHALTNKFIHEIIGTNEKYNDLQNFNNCYTKFNIIKKGKVPNYKGNVVEDYYEKRMESAYKRNVSNLVIVKYFNMIRTANENNYINLYNELIGIKKQETFNFPKPKIVVTELKLTKEDYICMEEFDPIEKQLLVWQMVDIEPEPTKVDIPKQKVDKFREIESNEVFNADDFPKLVDRKPMQMKRIRKRITMKERAYTS